MHISHVQPFREILPQDESRHHIPCLKHEVRTDRLTRPSLLLSLFLLSGESESVWLRFGFCMRRSTVFACCHCRCCHASPFRRSVVPLAGLWAVVGGRCRVLVDAVWLCMTRALLRPVLTCVAAYTVSPGWCCATVMYHLESYKTVVVMIRLIHTEPWLVSVSSPVRQIHDLAFYCHWFAAFLFFSSLARTQVRA